ncbi:nuclear transport factor 2 family protein [Nonomuraea lactucae]|uniref:nuclear transport factor 2 family protein n=1 Tax=Nonomuraea lactucae TaxID=2249762 RepID=UPI000DE3C2D2|nr:nuclear transport factor 2 family protein [Nonomuraea lactucae]
MTADLFDRQLAAIADRDLEALLAQYHDEATVIGFDRVARGPAEIRDLFTAYLAAEPEVEEITSLQTVDDVVFYNARMTVAGNRVTTFGTLVVKDGRIWRQTAAALPLSSA